MSFQTPITISSAIRNIENNHYLLPAIQREFSWDHEKIEWLFDSIMQDYPISSFLFWRVEGNTKTNYKFYQFIKDYRERYQTHNTEIPTGNHNDFTAVLDGQQRLTSLYIGLRGSYAFRIPRLHEEDSERVYPTRHLYLNIDKPLENEEDGRHYEFKFLTNSDYEANVQKWVKVSEIYNLSDNYEFNKYLSSNNLSTEYAQKALSKLHGVIHNKAIINFFLETEQSLDKALNIFIRINSGGEPLNFSDLIMSIAVANWEKRDARKAIHALVDNIRDKGFTISKDFILKTFLYLHSKDIKFKVANFSKENAVKFESEWEKIRDSILSTFDLIRSFGFTDSTLTSKNALIPIVYYIYHRNIYENFHSKVSYAEDRNLIKKWLHIVLIKRIFGGTSDSVLTQIRKTYTTEISKNYLEFEFSEFPIDSINDNIKRDVGISDEFIEDILLTQKDDLYAFSILALLYPNLDYKNNNFHKDHLHPAIKYDAIKDIESNQVDWETYNSIMNLQMLDANENQSKQDKDLSVWVDSETKSRDKVAFFESHLIPDCSLDLRDLAIFLDKRKLLLNAKLRALLS